MCGLWRGDGGDWIWEWKDPLIQFSLLPTSAPSSPWASATLVTLSTQPCGALWRVSGAGWLFSKVLSAHHINSWYLLRCFHEVWCYSFHSSLLALFLFILLTVILSAFSARGRKSPPCLTCFQTASPLKTLKPLLSTTSVLPILSQLTLDSPALWAKLI